MGRRIFSRIWIAAVCAAVLCVCAVPARRASAASDAEDMAYETIDASDALPDNDERFAGYAERELYGYGISLCGTTAGDNLSGSDRSVYDDLKAQIQKMASGEIDSISGYAVCSGATLSFAVEDSESTEEAISRHIKTIINSLLADCPYDLYWYDKTAGVGYGCKLSGSSSETTVNACLYFIFYVSEDYADTSSANKYGYYLKTDTEKTSAVTTAVGNAQEIVEDYADKDDIDKLTAYKTEICALTSYNTDAASQSSSTAYGDPWQLIWVFDGDEDTEVVCEGYAKAFQYLCDLSEFADEDVVCYTATGTMLSADDGTGGAHMWNVVTLPDGHNYMADLTNCDANTIGAPDLLFLKVPARLDTDTGTYTFTVTSGTTAYTLTYQYDEDTTSVYSEEELVLHMECTHSWDDGEVVCAATCAKEGSMRYICRLCWERKTETIAIDPDNHSGGTVITGQTEATCTESGYTGDTYCVACGVLLVSGTKIAVDPTAHSWDDGVVTTEPTATTEGVRTYTCALCGEKKTETIAATGDSSSGSGSTDTSGSSGDGSADTSGSSGGGSAGTSGSSGGGSTDTSGSSGGGSAGTSGSSGGTSADTSGLVPAAGTTLTDAAGGGVYTVTGTDPAAPTVTYKKPAAKKKTAAVPDTVTIGGVVYRVTRVADNAFKNNKKLKQVTIGANVTTIGKNAFSGCTALKKVTIGKAVKKIGKKAFYNCRSLKTIVIKTKKLTLKTVGAKAFYGLHKKAAAKVPSAKLKAYKKLLKKRGFTRGTVKKA